MELVNNQELEVKNEVTSENTQNTDNTGISEQVKAPTKNELLREMSKEYGVNMFDAEGIKQFKDWQDSQKTELQKAQEELGTLKNAVGDKDAKITELESQLLARDLNINPDKLGDAIILAKSKGEVNKDTLTQVVEQYPSFKNVVEDSTNKVKIKLGEQTNDQEPVTKKPLETFLEGWNF